MNKTIKTLFIISFFISLFSCSIIPPYQTLSLGTTNFTIYFDPYKYNKTPTLSLNQHIFESLVSIDNTGKIIPLLAENWINIDNKTWIFNLRKGIKFSDGAIFTADDVIFSFERVKVDTKSDGKTDFGITLVFSKIEKLNDYSIKIVTEETFPTLLLKLRNCSILPKNYIEKNGFDYFLKNPVGTGPYMSPIIKTDKDTKIVRLTRNERYWGKKPFFKNVEFIITSQENLLNYFNKNEIDCFVWAKSDFKKISNFNPLSLENVRKAIYYSLNLNELVMKVFGDTATAANQLVSPNIVGFNSSLNYQYQNIELAKRLLKEVNLSDGFSLNLSYSNKYYNFDQIGLLLKEYLKHINIDLNLIKLKDSEFDSIKKDGSFDIIPYSLSSGTGDALFILSTLIHSRNKSWGLYNFNGFSDKQIDYLIEKVSEEFDEQKRISQYQKIMELVMNKLPYIPLYWPNVLAIVKNKIKWQIRPDERIYAFEMSY